MSFNKLKPSSSFPQKRKFTREDIKTTASFRGFLIEQMIAVADGEQEPEDAKAICNYAQQIYNTVNLEIRHANAKSKHGDKPFEPVDIITS